VHLITSFLEDADLRGIRATCKPWCQWIPKKEFKLNIRPGDNVENIIQRLQQNPDLVTVQFNKTNHFLALKIRDKGLYTITSLKRLILDFKWKDPFFDKGELFIDPPSNALLNCPDSNSSVLSYFTQLEHLSAAQVSPDVVFHLTNLTSLHLTNSGSFELARILTSTRLHDLSLHSCKELITVGLTPNSTLTRLVISKTTLPEKNTTFLSNLNNLKELELYTSMTFFSLPSTTLEALALRGSSAAPSAILTISLNTNLTRLDINGGFYSDDALACSFEAWSKLTKLQVLNLQNFGMFNTLPTEKFDFLTNLKSLAEFREITAANSSSEVFEYLQPDKLTQLAVGYAREGFLDDVDDYGHKEVSLSKFHNLQELSVQMANFKLVGLPELTQLTSLEFPESSSVPNFDSLTQLKRLKVVHWSRRLFDYSTVTHLHNLESFDVCSWEKSGRVDLSVISQLTKLQKLQVQDRRTFSGLTALSNLTSLEILDVPLNQEFCNEIGQLTNLRELAVPHAGDAELQPLTALQKLTFLHSSIRYGQSELRWYTALTQIRVLAPACKIATERLVAWSQSLPHLVALLNKHN
jgi:hypothetical protein